MTLPTDEMIEKAAVAIYGQPEAAWNNLGKWFKDDIRKDARAALLAVIPEIVEEWRECVEDLVTQFAASSAKDGRYAITTAGLSALEGGFAILGWGDPHPMPEAECEREGCHKLATCGTPTPDGYKRLCSEHGMPFFRSLSTSSGEK